MKIKGHILQYRIFKWVHGPWQGKAQMVSTDKISSLCYNLYGLKSDIAKNKKEYP